MSTEFKDGDLVWAKMGIFSPWPSMILTSKKTSSKSKAKKGSQWVLFFGSMNYGWVPNERIQPYLEHKDKLSTTENTAAFQNALEQIEEHIRKSKDEPNYELDLPPERKAAPKKKDDPEDKFDKLLHSKKPTKTTPAKRKSSDSAKNATPKRVRISSPTSSAAKQPASYSSSQENGYSYSFSASLGSDILSKSSFLDEGDPSSSTADFSKPSPFLKSKNIVASAKTFGFIGVGNIGCGVVNNLVKSGHKVNLYSRTMKKCEDIKEQADAHYPGLVHTYTTPCDIMENSDIIFCCVTDPQAVKEIVFGNCGIAGRESDSLEGKGYVEMTSIDLQTSKDNGRLIKSRGGLYLEAQVQGSKEEADDGTLVVLTAGDKELFEECQSCFKAMGKGAFYLGEVGYAIKTNISMQIMKGTTLVGLAEALALADRCGINPEDMLNIFKWSNISCDYLNGKAAMIIKKDFKQVQQALEHMQKDMKLALDLSDQYKQPLLMTSTANEVYKHARRLRYDGNDCSCIYMRTRH